MIDLSQPPNLVLKEILKLPYSEQQEWIEKWESQIPPEINTSIPKYKPVSVSQDWQEVPECNDDALDRPRTGKFGRKEKQEYAKTKAESEMKAFLEDPEKVKQASKEFRNKVKKDLERLGL